jgi:hypothetical protein
MLVGVIASIKLKVRQFLEKKKKSTNRHILINKYNIYNARKTKYGKKTPITNKQI